MSTFNGALSGGHPIGKHGNNKKIGTIPGTVVNTGAIEDFGAFGSILGGHMPLLPTTSPKARCAVTRARSGKRKSTQPTKKLLLTSAPWFATHLPMRWDQSNANIGNTATTDLSLDRPLGSKEVAHATPGLTRPCST